MVILNRLQSTEQSGARRQTLVAGLALCIMFTGARTSSQARSLQGSGGAGWSPPLRQAALTFRWIQVSVSLLLLLRLTSDYLPRDLCPIVPCNCFFFFSLPLLLESASSSSIFRMVKILRGWSSRLNVFTFTCYYSDSGTGAEE